HPRSTPTPYTTLFRSIVGVNDFVVDEQPELEPLRVSAASLKAQVERLRRIRRTRDAKKHARSLDQLRKGCEGDANTMPLILDARSEEHTSELQSPDHI